MLIVMNHEATSEQIDAVLAAIETLGYRAEPIPGSMRTAIGVLGNQGYVDDSSITCTVLNFKDDKDHITIKTGIFFTEILICCGCGDDPVPENAYCEIMIKLDKKNAKAIFEIIDAD